jgi:hypothetical protein
MFFVEQAPESICAVVKAFEGASLLCAKSISDHAKGFNEERFRDQIYDIVQKNLKQKQAA